jgi:hypothetical protein
MDEPYCDRCERGFPSVSAREQHYDYSYQHHCCLVCLFDGYSGDELLQHYRNTGHRTVCMGCSDGHGLLWIPGCQEYFDHLEAQNVCTICERHFESRSNLEHVGEKYLDSKGIQYSQLIPF